MVKLLSHDVLRGCPTTKASSVDEAQAKIAALLNDHKLAPHARGKSVDMRLRSLHRGDVGIEYLDYGSEVRIDSAGLEDFFLVQIPLAGRARMLVGAVSIDSSPRVASIPPVDRRFAMEWDRGTPHLIVYVRRSALEEVAGRLYGNGTRAGSELGYSMNLGTPLGQAFLRTVVELHDDMVKGPQSAPGFVQQLLADAMVSRLLLAMDKAPAEAGQRKPGSDSRLVRRFGELLENHAMEQLTVPCMAEFLGTSVRTLQSALRTELGASPSELLRRERLNRAREILLERGPGDETVISVADRCGFSHPGRFASSYMEAFGELPSESLRR